MTDEDVQAELIREAVLSGNACVRAYPTFGLSESDVVAYQVFVHPASEQDEAYFAFVAAGTSSLEEIQRAFEEWLLERFSDLVSVRVTYNFYEG